MKNLSSKYQPWVEARRRFHLSDTHIQMARELGLNPKKFGGLANHKQESWKAPLPVFIADLYRNRFGKNRSVLMKCPFEQETGVANRKMNMDIQDEQDNS